MILDTYLNPKTTYKADICIIGAGAAGITIAKELANTTLEVLVLETGGEEFDPEIAELNEGEIDYSNDSPGYVLETTRFRGLGGTTNLWSGCSAPFTEMDMKRRDWMPFSGWPIKRKELESFYVRSHKFLGLGRYFDGAYNAEQILLRTSLNNIPFDGTNGTIHKLFRYMRNPLRFKKIAFTLRRHRRIKFLTHAHCTDFHLSKNGKVIERVSAVNFRGWRGTIQAKRFIIAAGGIDNAKILLNTEKNGLAALGNKYDQVGRYFMEHAHIPCGWISGTNNKPWITGKSAYRTNMFHEYMRSNARHASGKPDWVIGTQVDFWYWFVVGPSDQAQKLHKIGNFSASLDVVTQGGQDWISKRSENNRFPADANYKFFNTLDSYPGTNSTNLTPDNNQSAMIYCRMEQSPNPDSRVYLSEKKDRLGLRQVKLCWALNDLDKRTAIISTRLIAEEIGRLSYGRVKLEDWLIDNRAWNNVGPSFGCHHMGTTRMGTDKKTSVVDANCKVHDLANLYIAGSSVFPTSSYVNPTLNLVTLAIRLADHLKNSGLDTK